LKDARKKYGDVKFPNPKKILRINKEKG